MDAPEIEKLKALALAAKQHGYKQWINPTAVLALIAEVERLRGFIDNECRGFHIRLDEDINEILSRAPPSPEL